MKDKKKFVTSLFMFAFIYIQIIYLFLYINKEFIQNFFIYNSPAKISYEFINANHHYFYLENLQKYYPILIDYLYF